MPRVPRLTKLVAAVLVLTVLGASTALAQQPAGPKPVMENVFFNVVWGSAAGALVGAAIAVVGAKDKEKPGSLSNAGFEGATIGGVAGLGLGIYLVFTGITFDPERSTILNLGSVRGLGAMSLPSVPQVPSTPFMLFTSKDHPSHITGFSAQVVNFRF